MAIFPFENIQDPKKTGTVIGNIKEWFVGPNESSAAGLQRAENVKAREHSSAERIASEKFNKEEARIAREWQEEMSNTSYQRMIKDLEKAGINPMLVMSQGGASTPSGTSAKSSASPSGASQTRGNEMGDLVKIIALFTAGLTSSQKIASAERIARQNINNQLRLEDLRSINKQWQSVAGRSKLNVATRLLKGGMETYNETYY